MPWMLIFHCKLTTNQCNYDHFLIFNLWLFLCYFLSNLFYVFYFLYIWFSFYPCETTSIKITLNDIPLSFLAQSLFHNKVFYDMLNQRLKLKSELSTVKIFDPTFYSIVFPSKVLFKMILTTPIEYDDKYLFENAISNFIKAYSIGKISSQNFLNYWNNLVIFLLLQNLMW